MSDDLHALRLSRIAHELRGSAGVALGATSEIKGTLSPEGEKFIGMAQRGLERVLRIADRLGRASALERKLVEFRREPGDFGDFVTQETQKSREIEHKVTIEVTVAITSPQKIELAFDAEWFGYAIREIVSNAIQHARQRVKVAVTTAGNDAIVAVEDDGPGFRDDIDLAFSASPNPRRGIGLSLPVCRAVVEDGHGGALIVGNAPSGGARVELRVPRNRAGK